MEILVAAVVVLAACFLPGPVGAATIYEYPLQSKIGPVGITTGPDDALWFLEYYANNIGRMDPVTHAVTQYAIPTPNSRAVQCIITGPDNALWFAEGGDGNTPNGANKIGRIDPNTDKITEYSPPTPDSGPAYIAIGPDGDLWFTEQFPSQIGRIDPNNPTAITEYTTPTSGSDPWNIITGPDGDLWFNECGPNNIVHIDRTTLKMTEYQADGVCGGMAVADGAIWFISDHNARQPKIGQFDPSAHMVVNEYPVPTVNSNPDALTVGPDGALWFAEFKANKIGRLDLSTYTFTEYKAPGAGFMTNGPQNSLWFTAPFANKVGQVAPYPAPVAPTKVTAAATGVGQATVDFTVPVQSGVSYTVTSSPAGGNDTNIASTSLSHVVNNLKNGIRYAFTVTATDSIGMSATSKASNKITTWAAPSLPGITILKAGNLQVTVSFSASKTDPGDPVNYTVTATANGQNTQTESGSKSPLTVTNLTNNVTYAFTVKATNQVGSNVSSSKSIAPKAPSK